MGQKSGDGEESAPSLELPSLFGRKRKGSRADDADSAPADAEQASAADLEPTDPDGGTAAELEPAENEATTVIPVSHDHVADEPVVRPDESQDVEPRRVQAEPRATDERWATEEPAAPEQPRTDEDEAVEDDATSGTGFGLPAVSSRVAVLITGVVVGVLGGVLTYLAMRGCEAVRGTSSCGGAGFFLLVAILVLMVLLGAILLNAWQVSDPGSTSFLAVGVVAVVILVALVDVIFSAWMFVVVPVLGAAAFALSHWVTTRFVEDQERPWQDVA